MEGCSTTDSKLNTTSESFTDKLVGKLNKITVEPVVLFYAFSVILHVPLIQQYVHQRITRSKGMTYNTTESLSNCDPLPLGSTARTLKIQKEVQSEASFITLGLVFSVTAPSLFVALFLGAWSDRVGRKKVMSVPIFGSVVESIIILVVIHWKLPLLTLLLAGFINGCCGFFPTFILSVFSYIADVTEESQRAFRLGVLEAIAFVSGMLSHLTSGWFINKAGYRVPYLLIFALHTSSLLYVTLILPESRDKLQMEQSETSLLSLDHIRAIISIFTRPRSDVNARWRMGTLMLVSAIMMLCSIGFGSVIVLYALDRPLCCNSIIIGYYLALTFLIQAIGAVVGLKFLAAVLSEHTLIQVASTSIVASLVTIAFVKSKTTLFMGRWNLSSPLLSSTLPFPSLPFSSLLFSSLLFSSLLFSSLLFSSLLFTSLLFSSLLFSSLHFSSLLFSSLLFSSFLFSSLLFSSFPFSSLHFHSLLL